jgi:hypothetical protein
MTHPGAAHLTSLAFVAGARLGGAFRAPQAGGKSPVIDFARTFLGWASTTGFNFNQGDPEVLAVLSRIHSCDGFCELHHSPDRQEIAKDAF